MEERALVKADLGNNRIIQLEVRKEGDPESDVGIRDLLSFDGFVDSVEAITDSVMSALRNAKPDKAVLEFGLDVGLEAGQLTSLLVKGTGTATLKVTLEWQSGESAAAATNA